MINQFGVLFLNGVAPDLFAIRFQTLPCSSVFAFELCTSVSTLSERLPEKVERLLGFA